jgi:hypothetical protein
MVITLKRKGTMSLSDHMVSTISYGMHGLMLGDAQTSDAPLYRPYRFVYDKGSLHLQLRPCFKTSVRDGHAKFSKHWTTRQAMRHEALDDSTSDETGAFHSARAGPGHLDRNKFRVSSMCDFLPAADENV